ncbi:MAG: YggS family pyridoxal phosphate-dependent enzyme [Candidatus Nanopelagicaceae bacterium]|nr:YggS family pyridoxal phosphate-dependent enzyme [Candidatus Nanopelagicaceae bacterium]
MSSSARHHEISQNLAAVEREICLAVKKSNRERSEITLIVVTKNFPASDVVHLYDLGIRNFGENRDQEAKAKVEEFKNYVADDAKNEKEIKWHFQGQLQRNKLRSIATWADFIHSFDQERYLLPLQQLSIELEKPISLLLQLSLDLPIRPDRGGVAPEELIELGEKVKQYSGLKLQGLMAVAPLDVAPELAFNALKTISGTFLKAFPDADWISAGMSGDFAAAIAAGATHLRVGSSILGSRV